MTVPYPMQAAVDTETRHQQMLVAIKRGYTRLRQVPIDDRQTLHVACYGPSLQDTWRDLGRPLISMSGATRFLAERGVIADYHIEMDPRAHKVKFIDPPIPGVHYLMASVCHPSVWDILKGQTVTLWHAQSADTTPAFVEAHDPGALCINVGMHVGLAALHVGGVLGYRHFEIHGMDGSFAEGARHAGVHYGKAQASVITWDAGCVTYRTSKIMADQVHVTLGNLKHYPIFCVFHGRGLQQALVREAGLDNACCADETEKAARIRKATAVIYPAPGGVNYRDPVSAEWAKFQALAEGSRMWLSVESNVAETRRALANYDTGSISLDAMVLLRGVMLATKPQVIAEVGTFIGKSTVALLGPGVKLLWTVDRSNNCLEEFAPEILTHPFKDATEMFAKMLDAGERVDLFFFDGRLGPQDIPLILRLSTRRTVYVFDDYVGQEKGVANVNLLAPFLPDHALLLPPTMEGVTLATLLPVKGDS